MTSKKDLIGEILSAFDGVHKQLSRIRVNAEALQDEELLVLYGKVEIGILAPQLRLRSYVAMEYGLPDSSKKYIERQRERDAIKE